jgi:hypothetical protein
MANITLNTSANFDDVQCQSLLNGETITIDNGTLTIDSDVRWAQNGAVIGVINVGQTTPALPSGLLVDATKVWWIPFINGTGTVPSLGTVGAIDVIGSIAGRGEFLGIWTALATAPLSSSTPMPSTGFIKLRRKTVDFANSEVITLSNSATLTVNSATGGQRGWLHFVGVGTTTGGINANSTSSIRFVGDWFELGTTNGTTNQTFTYPVQDACLAIWVETSAGSGVYEKYYNGSIKWGTATQLIATDVRGKFFGFNDTTGVITLANRTVGASCGFLPPAGCKVRVPNLHLSNSTSANWNANLSGITDITNGKFKLNGANSTQSLAQYTSLYLKGVNAICNISGFAMQDFTMIDSSAHNHGTTFNNYIGKTTLQNVCFGFSTAAFSTNNSCLITSNCDLTADDVDIVWALTTNSSRCLQQTSARATSIGKIKCLMFPNSQTTSRSKAGTNTGLIAIAGSGSIKELTAIGSGVFVNNCQDFTVDKIIFSETITGASQTTGHGSIIQVSTGNKNLTFNGIEYLSGVTDAINPLLFMNASVSSGCDKIYIKNVGSVTNPLSTGTGAVLSSRFATLINGIKYVFSNIYLSGTFLTGNTPFTTSTSYPNQVTLQNFQCDVAPNFVFNNLLAQGGKYPAITTVINGAVGVHWHDSMTSSTTGVIQFQGNAPTDTSYKQCINTTGNAVFNLATGSVHLINVGDQIIAELPYYALRYTAFDSLEPLITGTNTSNHLYEYQVTNEQKQWNGVWQILTAANLTQHTINPSVGVKIKLRVTCITASPTNSIALIDIRMKTTSSAALINYPTIYSDDINSNIALLAISSQLDRVERKCNLIPALL